MATPVVGNVRFQGASGRSYNKAVYLSDVANVPAKFAAGGDVDANGDTNIVFDEPVLLADAAFASGMTVAARLEVTRNGVPTGDSLVYANQLVSVTNRIALAIPFLAGQRCGLVQK